MISLISLPKVIPKSFSIWRKFQIMPLVQPTIIGNDDILLFGAKNSRRPKRANHGARPCSSFMRRLKRREIHGRYKSHEGGEEYED